MKYSLAIISLFLTLAFTHASAIEGQVSDPDGRPISRSRVGFQDSSDHVFTDTRGRFRIPEEMARVQEGPLVLEISHPTHITATVALELPMPEGIEVRLERRQMFNEEVVVTAGSPSPEFAPIGASATTISTENKVFPASTLSDLVPSVPGVALNGQGGQFRNYSIRGVSRHRILTSLSGVRLTTERRSGVSASFIDPFLLEGISLIRGPASSYHGSAALGGVVDLMPRNFQGSAFRSTWSSQGNERFLGTGWGDKGFSFGAAVRKTENAEAPNGEELNTHFTQYSASFSNSWAIGDDELKLLVIPAFAEDIGKSNTDYPDKSTSYPRERHLIGQLSYHSADRWQVQAFVHPQDLYTLTSEPASVAEVFNDSFDAGISGAKELILNPSTSLRLGGAYFSRQGVDSREVQTDLARQQSPTVIRSLDGANEDEFDVLSSLRHDFRHFSVEGGTRFSHNRQQNAALTPLSENAWNAFAGVTYPVKSSLELNASVGTGLRFPSLSERFYVGTTGRGSVIGNPELTSERSLNTDVGVRWFGSRVYLSTAIFRNEISDYIERVEIEPDLLTYVNLDDGTISGLEWEGGLSPAAGWQIFARGHWIRGKDDKGHYLADIPTDQAAVGFSHQHGRWTTGAEFQFRSEKEDPGSGEKVIPTAQVLSGFVRMLLTESVSAEVSAANLTNELYFETADRKGSWAPGRTVLIGLNWALQ